MLLYPIILFNSPLLPFTFLKRYIKKEKRKKKKKFDKIIILVINSHKGFFISLLSHSFNFFKATFLFELLITNKFLKFILEFIFLCPIILFFIFILFIESVFFFLKKKKKKPLKPTLFFLLSLKIGLLSISFEYFHHFVEHYLFYLLTLLLLFNFVKILKNDKSNTNL